MPDTIAIETQQKTRERNQAWFGLLDSGQEKRAADAVSNFTRTKMREDGFYRKILPPVKITNDELDRAVDTEKPLKIVDKENDNPPAISLPFANLPVNIYVKAPKYRVLFDRIVSPRFTKDVDELRTYQMDVRQVMTDNAIKDMLAEEDTKFLAAVNVALGTKDSTQPLAQAILYKGISGGITRDSTVESLKIMNRSVFRLEAHTCLTNFVTWKEFMKWGRDEMGGDLSEQIVKNGMAEAHFLSKDWVVTIKRDLVPDDNVYMFADPKFIGKNFLLEDTTLWMKREMWFLDWCLYLSGGGAIGHVGGLARAAFE